jgi:two-component system, sensor histidine kinase and response regulator
VALSSFEQDRREGVSQASTAVTGTELFEPRITLAAMPGTVAGPQIFASPLRAGLSLLLLFEVVYFVVDLLVIGADSQIVAAHVLNIAAPAAFLLVLRRPFFAPHWRAAVLACCAIVVAGTLVCSLSGGDLEWLLVTTIMLMVGVGTLVPWGHRWQLALTSTSLGAMMVGGLDWPSHSAESIPHWVALLAAAGLGFCMTALGRRYRCDSSKGRAEIDTPHDEIAQIAEREAVATDRERSLQRQRDSEGQLRELNARGVEAELITAREAAIAASKAKSDFVSDISHEIRTPMNAILGTADLLSDTPLSFEQRHYVETMRTNGNAMLALVNRVLDLARVESGQLNLEHIDFNLREVVEKALETLAISAHQKKLELAARIVRDVPLALIGDPLRLRQILVNLIANAVKFTEHGEVIVTIETLPAPLWGATAAWPEATGWFRISVADTGVGILPDQRDAIFRGFAQANSSTAREYGGSGLGLAIVRRLVELMHGRIEVESEVGKGSTFSIFVPFGLQDRALAVETAHVPDESVLRRKVVLIADDTLANRVILEEWLTEYGAQTATAVDGAVALTEVRKARLAGRPYDLLLLDARMPGMDGITVAQTLLNDRHDERPSVREAIVLMLTPDDLTPALARIREIGFDADSLCSLVVKPLKRAELLAETTRVLAPNGISGRFESEATAAQVSTAVERPLRILLAEDSVDNRLLIEAFLKQHPYALEFAENGQTAIDRVVTTAYDLVLMDIQMPVVDGYTAVRRIREWERGQGRVPVPIIALTASALDEAVRRSLDAGCDAHIAKPVRKATLVQAIRDATASPPGRPPLTTMEESR